MIKAPSHRQQPTFNNPGNAANGLPSREEAAKSPGKNKPDTGNASVNFGPLNKPLSFGSPSAGPRNGLDQQRCHNSHGGSKQSLLEQVIGSVAKTLAKLLVQQATEQVTAKLQNGSAQMLGAGQPTASMPTATTGNERPATSGKTGDVAAVQVKNPDGSIKETEKEIKSKPTAATGRPAGDTRSAEEIINANPILKNLGDQKDINREGAYKQLGDWTENNKDPKARADAAYNAAKVLNWIDTSKTAGGDSREKVSGKGDLYGITKDGDARHGTPAGNWKDFTEKGYGALKDDHRLDKTKDPYVYEDGTNKSGFKGFVSSAAQKLWFIPILSNTLKGVGDSKDEDGFLGALKGGLSGYANTFKDAIVGAVDGLKKGKFSPVQMFIGAYTNQLSNTEAAPEKVRKVADKI